MKTKYKWVACWWCEDEKMWVPSSGIKINKGSCRAFINDQMLFNKSFKEEHKLDGCTETKWTIAKVNLEEGDAIE